MARRWRTTPSAGRRRRPAGGPEIAPARSARRPRSGGSRVSSADLVHGPPLTAALLLGTVSAVALLLIFALSTWLPELMGRAGLGATGSLALLLVLNGGAVVGSILAAPLAERFGPRRVVATSFALGALALVPVGLQPPAFVRVALIAVVGLGTTGPQILVVGLATATFGTRVRGAGVARCTGFGRLGGIVEPVAVGLLVGAGLPVAGLFAALAALAILGALLTLLVRPASGQPTPTGL